MLKEKVQRTDAWEGFREGRWNRKVDVREFIQLNYTLYEGTDEFLSGPTEAPERLWKQVLEL